MPDCLQHALAAAAAGMPVFRLSNSKLPLKDSHGHRDATTDPDLIRSWFEGRDLNLGLACGAWLVLDFDGAEAFQSPWGQAFVAAAQAAGGVPKTATVLTRRGVHLYFRAPPGREVRTRNEPRATKGQPGLDIKGAGGYVVMPPSIANGHTYLWQGDTIAVAPEWLLAWIDGLGGQRPASAAAAPLPPHLVGKAVPAFMERATREPAPDPAGEDAKRIRSALEAIPASAYDTWIQVGMGLWSTGWDNGSATGLSFQLFDAWSRRAPDKYSELACVEKWRSFAMTSRNSVTLGTIFHLARQHGWSDTTTVAEIVPENHQLFQPVTTPPGQAAAPQFDAPAQSTSPSGESFDPSSVFKPKTPANPLAELNERFCVIGNLGGKCLVLEWVQSRHDPNVKIPTFQTFRSFTERFASKYVQYHSKKVNKDGIEEVVEKSDQLGSFWLKWAGRPTFEGMDLDPTGGPILPGNVLNLWKGWGVPAAPGAWPLMQRHILEVLASGDQRQAAYIIKWAAWAIQHPEKQAEAALVFRGNKGSGKGTFANAMRRLFGQHGLHVFNSKHLVGQFNAHLRSCLLLFADEAFWAGDKQGESTLKGLITEDTIPIEKKGVDVEHCVNRLHVIMAANADWVVPASHDERRYTVYDVSSRRVGDRAYFRALREEIENGGLSAMLYDLQRMPLGGWHPREVIDTAALQEQKARSLDPLHDWYVGILQDGYALGKECRVPAAALLQMVHDSSGRLRDVSAQGLGRMLRKYGVQPIHSQFGTVWEFPALDGLRKEWEKHFGEWRWDSPDLQQWRQRA